MLAVLPIDWTFAAMIAPPIAAFIVEKVFTGEQWASRILPAVAPR
jgi:hypothetical protein